MYMLYADGILDNYYLIMTITHSTGATSGATVHVHYYSKQIQT